MPITTHPRDNDLLAALGERDWLRWQPQMEPVDLPWGKVLFEPGGVLGHLYFPTTAIVSLLFVLKDGHAAETAMVGREGVVGISTFLGGGSTVSRAVVQSAGQGFRVAARFIKAEFDEKSGRNASVVRMLLRYTQALMTQMAQTAACTRHHTLDQQLSRWLLLSLDRLEGSELAQTQEMIARLLGVRREGVTAAALKLQSAALIRYARGRIQVLDRTGLELRSCECYGVVKREYERLLPDLRANRMAARALAHGQLPGPQASSAA
jgi:CRP-like cAMP-binding protein